MKTKTNYLSPEIEILSVATENTFAQSRTDTTLQDFEFIMDSWEEKNW